MTLFPWIKSFSMHFTAGGKPWKVADISIDAAIKDFVGGPTAVYEYTCRAKVGLLGAPRSTFQDVEVECEGSADDVMEHFIEKCAEAATGLRGPDGN